MTKTVSLNQEGSIVVSAGDDNGIRLFDSHGAIELTGDEVQVLFEFLSQKNAQEQEAAQKRRRQTMRLQQQFGAKCLVDMTGGAKPTWQKFV